MSVIYVIVKEITRYNEDLAYEYDQQDNICAYSTLAEARNKLASIAEQHQIHHGSNYTVSRNSADCWVFARNDERKERSFFIDQVAFGVQL